jgi:drug/metabolite transporter (DMT)-like permease
VPLAALILVVGAAVCHSAWNLIFKSEPRRLEASLGALAVATALGAPVLLLYSPSQLPATAWALVLLSGALETGYVVALTAAYEVGELSLVYPIARGTAPLLVAPLAVLLLGERLSLPGLLGISLVVLGSFATGVPASRPISVVEGLGRGSPHTAIALAMLTGLMISGYSLVNKAGVQQAPVPLYAFLVFAVDTGLLALVLRLRGRGGWPQGGAAWGRASAVGVLMLAAYLGVLAAMSLAPVSYVVAAREVSIVLTALAGSLVLREHHSTRRVAAAAVIFAGLLVLALSR